MSSHKHTILYAEDDLDDLFLVQQSFQQYNDDIDLVHVANGADAMQYLEANIGHLPCLVILDINMPVMDGRETLKKIKQHPRLKNMPVVLFTTSSSDPDKVFANEWGADFITKPLVYSELEKMATQFVGHCDQRLTQPMGTNEKDK